MQSYLVGYTSGWNGADVGARLLTDAPANDGKTQLLSSGSGILSGAGWGRCEIEYDDATGQVHWIFPEGTAIGLAARQEGRRDKPACPFVAGFVAGWHRKRAPRGRRSSRARFDRRRLRPASPPTQEDGPRHRRNRADRHHRGNESPIRREAGDDRLRFTHGHGL